MKTTKQEKRDAELICNAYFDLFQGSSKPSILKIQNWVRNYQIREDYNLN